MTIEQFSLMDISTDIIFVVGAYLLGSVPFGYIFTKKTTGKNILFCGSGNIGSTNVARIAGKKISLITQLCDMAKGLLPVCLVLSLNHIFAGSFNFYTVYLVAVSAILGHNFSVFLKLKGGKGVNTTLGASLLLAPLSVLLAVILFFFVKWKSRYVSLGSICLGVSLPLTDLAFHYNPFPFFYLVVCAALIVVQHIPNIKRLLQGTEKKCLPAS